MKNRLDGAMFYLAGPMDDVADRGSKWRIEIASFLWKLGIGVLCPFNKPIFDAQNEDDNYYKEINSLKEQGRYQEAHDRMKIVAAEDYRMVDKADALILYLDKNAHMCGSYHENCMAAYQRKPVIVCCPQGKSAIPNWMYSIARHEMFFEDWESVKNYILHVAYAQEVKDFNRWRFFDYDMIFGRKENESVMGS